ncbi:hypothetical protein QEW_4655 [Clostridioides difficile CD160]|nr:hypothetical protein QEW_4655 [Clostridioides difficile CD160]
MINKEEKKILKEAILKEQINLLEVNSMINTLNKNNLDLWSKKLRETLRNLNEILIEMEKMYK